MKNELYYWRMENGHEHSVVGMETEDVKKEFATFHSKTGEDLTQEQYRDYVAEHEHTYIVDEVVEEFDELTEEKAQEWEDKDYIAGFEGEGNDVLVEFY